MPCSRVTPHCLGDAGTEGPEAGLTVSWGRMLVVSDGISGRNLGMLHLEPKLRPCRSLGGNYDKIIGYSMPVLAVKVPATSSQETALWATELKERDCPCRFRLFAVQNLAS